MRPVHQAKIDANLAFGFKRSHLGPVTRDVRFTPAKRTLIERSAMSALCQKADIRTWQQRGVGTRYRCPADQQMRFADCHFVRLGPPVCRPG
jgi:hypothetical protein